MNCSDINTNSKNDVLLWQAFKKGDSTAFEQLYKKYFKDLGRYGLRLNPDKDLVEDAIQDVFIDLTEVLICYYSLIFPLTTLYEGLAPCKT